MSTQPETSNIPLKKRSVVSSFIFKLEGTPDGKPQVALFRRSDEVSTYRRHLAPISGSIDPTDVSPLAAAWREISEETTLTPSNLRLLRQGKGYTFSDPSIGREWTIYPFAFVLKTPADEHQIKIDWEHEGWGWHDPIAVVDTPEFNGVPRLAESLRRVWFEKDLGVVAGRILSDGLASLATDHVSGARQMAGHALRTLHDVIAALEPCEMSERWWRNVRFAAWHLWKNGRESMGAAILSAQLSALSKIETLLADPSPSADFRTAVLALLTDMVAERDKTTARIAESLSEYLTSTFPPNKPLTLLTLSQSSTITHSLVYLAHSPGVKTRPLHLHILESRPLFEGASLAASLISHLTSPSQITLYTDAASALAAHDVDAVLLGADRISGSGAASNKTGSLPAVLSARHVARTRGRDVKVVVVGDSEKVAPPGGVEEHVVEENDGGMVSRAWGVERDTALKEGARQGGDAVRVKVSNVFFEWVPADLIDVYITESGHQTLHDIAERSRKLGREEQRILGSL